MAMDLTTTSYQMGEDWLLPPTSLPTTPTSSNRSNGLRALVPDKERVIIMTMW